MLPFIFLTHDYSYNATRWRNNYGPGKDQIPAFLSWLTNTGKNSLFMSQFLDLYYDANNGMIVRNGDQWSVTRRGNANDIKIYVGSEPTYATGRSVISQIKINDWLYITLRSERESNFSLTCQYLGCWNLKTWLIVGVTATLLLATVATISRRISQRNRLPT